MNECFFLVIHLSADVCTPDLHIKANIWGERSVHTGIHTIRLCRGGMARPRCNYWAPYEAQGGTVRGGGQWKQRLVLGMKAAAAAEKTQSNGFISKKFTKLYNMIKINKAERGQAAGLSLKILK